MSLSKRPGPWICPPVALAAVGLGEDEVNALSYLAREEKGARRLSLARAELENPGVAKLLAWAAELENLPAAPLIFCYN